MLLRAVSKKGIVTGKILVKVLLRVIEYFCDNVFSVVMFEYLKTVIWAASPLPCLFTALSSLYCILFRFISSVGIELKELGVGQLPKCLKFCPGIEVYGRFSLKNERL